MSSRLLLALGALLAFLVSGPQLALASQCFAYVEEKPKIIPAAFKPAQTPSVEVTYIGHSTFRLRTAAGVVIATDYAGWAGRGPAPTLVTMNKAHETHYTDFPDPAIQYVLRGWNPKGGPADYHMRLADVIIRNVQTTTRGWDGFDDPYGNSIFIFEVADLCIGHLGHLHHIPTDEQLAKIGRLDVVFAPVDGSFTLALDKMIGLLKRLRASLVIPMHFFSAENLAVFLQGLKADFAIAFEGTATTKVSLATLPHRPTVLVLGEF